MSTALAEVFPAGEFLADELEARGWTQAEFAEVLGRPAQFVSEIVSGKKEITRESAAQIAAALGTSAEFWLNLQDSYFLWRQGHDRRTQVELGDVRLRARLQELAPVSVLVRRGVIKETTASGQAEELKQLFGLVDIYDNPEIVLEAWRSNPDERVSSTQMAWVACVRQRASSLKVATYSHERLVALAQELARDLVVPGKFRDVPGKLAGVGVRLVYVEAFPSSKIDGCSFMLDGAPVLGISGRGKRLDKVLFTLLHEIAHVTLGHLTGDALIVDDDSDALHSLGLEESADEQAGTWILPEPLPRTPDRVTLGWVQAAAAAQGVHPIVVIGRLQSLDKLTWRSALVKGAPNVTDELSKW